MIFTNDLRRSNLILFNPNKKIERVCKVKSIEERQICVTDLGVDLVLLEYQMKPIPLTPEILLKAKFKKGMTPNGLEKYDLGKYRIYLDDSTFHVNVAEGFYPTIIHSKNFKYLHQLQNIIYALTGQELEIKL